MSPEFITILRILIKTFNTNNLNIYKNSIKKKKNGFIVLDVNIFVYSEYVVYFRRKSTDKKKTISNLN